MQASFSTEGGGGEPEGKKNLSMFETEECQVNFAEKQLRCREKTALVWVGAVVHTRVCQHTWRWAASGGLKDWRQGSGVMIWRGY